MATGEKRLHDSFRPSRDYLIALIPLYVMATALYGARVFLLALCAVVTSFLCDLLAAIMQKKPFDITDISSYMFTLMFTALVPASARYEIVIITSAFIVLLAKNAFGGYRCYPFNPSMFGFALAAVCWPNDMFLYPKAYTHIGLGLDSGAATFAGVAKTLQQGGIPSADATDLLLGNYPGPLGGTFCLIILACFVLFVSHRTLTFHIPLAFLGTCAAWAALFPRVKTGIIDSLIFELFSGVIIFTAVFIAAQPDTSPRHPGAKLLYGVLVGLGTMFYRTFGAYEVGSCFVMLLANPLAPAFDRLFSKRGVRLKKRGRAK